MDNVSKKFLPAYDQELGLIFDMRDGKVDIVGRLPSSGDHHLDEVLRYLFNIKIKYPFVCFKPDDELIAIRVWHKDDPDVVFAVCKTTAFQEHIDDTRTPYPALRIESWDIDDSNEDSLLIELSIDGPCNSGNNTYSAALFVGMEIVRTDFTLADYHDISKEDV